MVKALIITAPGINCDLELAEGFLLAGAETSTMHIRELLENPNAIDEFDLIIDLQSKLRNTLILKQFPTKHFYSSTFKFKFCSLKKNFQSTKNEIKNIILNLEKLLETEIPFKKYSLDKIDKKFLL